MANENKKINELVSEEDDPTAELEVLSFKPPVEDADSQITNESDSHTYGLGKSVSDDAPVGQTIPELQSDLRSRTRKIGQLQYDIQQLRSKWLGLEAEIGAREEIAENLLRDNKKLSKTIERKNKLLKKRSASIKALKTEIRERDTERLQLEEQLAAQATADEEHASRRDKAEVEIKGLRDSLERAQTDYASIEADLQKRNDEYEALEKQLAEQCDVADKQTAALAEAKLEVEKLSKELESFKHEQQNLNREINQRDALESTLEEKVLDLEEQAAAQRSLAMDFSSQLEAAAQEISRLQLELETAKRQGAAEIVQTQKTTSSVVRELQARLEKTEQYADTLRFKLNDNSESLSSTRHDRDKARDEIEVLADRNADLSEELDAVRAANAELLASFEQQKNDHEQELRTLRFELTEAQQSIAESGDLNSQLTSDLLSARDLKGELENMLSRNEEQAKQRITELEDRIKDLSRVTEEFEEKLDTKNTAINVLLAELEKKSEQIDSIGEIEEVIQEIDNRMSERIDIPGTDSRGAPDARPAAPDRDRVTRVLVGSIGDQELRFPLFKNRLTIGRTADNDIQLKAPYVSRRHAVVITEGDSTRVIDWGSKNGVYVNAEKVKERFLSNGDIVAVGNAKFRYEERPKRDA